MSPEQIDQGRGAKVAGSNQEQAKRLSARQVGIIEVGILRDEYPTFRNCELNQGYVSTSIAVRKLGRVHAIMTCGNEQLAKAKGQMRIDHELHVNTRCWLRTCNERVANSKQARRSSRCRSGKSTSTSSIESPAARYSRTLSTGYLSPRITGLPWHTSGSMVIRLSSDAMRELAALPKALSMN